MNTQTCISIRRDRNIARYVAAIFNCFARRRVELARQTGITLLAITLAQTALAAVAPPLGTATGFAVLGATPDVNNTGPSVITGDLGVSPASAIIGFPPGTVIGSMHAANATAATAQVDNTTAYGALAGQACNSTFAENKGSGSV